MAQIYITDGDYEVMKKLESLINTYPKQNARCFTTHQRLIDNTRKESPDIVLIDVDSYNGLPAVRMLQLISPEAKIIIMSEEREKASEYFKLNTSGFLMKPIEEEKLKEQLYRVSHPMLAKIKYGSERTESV